MTIKAAISKHLLEMSQTLDQQLFGLVSKEVQDKNDFEVAKINNDEAQIGNEDPQKLLEQEKIKQKKQEIERLKAKQSILLTNNIEKKILNNDLSVLESNVQSPTRQKQNVQDDKNKAVKEQGLDDAKLLVKKINEEKREREKRRQEMLRLEQEKTQREIEERQKKQDEEISKLEEEKRQKREEAEKRIKQRIEERQQSQQRMIVETKKIAKKPKLYQEIEKKFSEEQIRELEKERLEKLKEIKDNHKSVNKDDIESHSRKYDDLMRQKKEELRKKRGGLEYQSESTDQLRNYKSKFYEDILNNEKEQKEQMFKEKQDKKKMQDKVGSYAKYVKEMYWPQVSEQKRLQLESVKENIRHPLRRDNEDNAMYSAPVGQQEKKRAIARHGTADNRVNYTQQHKSKNVTSVRNLQSYVKDDNISSHSSQNGQNIKHNGFSSEPEMMHKDEERRPQRRNIKPLAQNSNQSQLLNENQKKPPKDYLREFKSKRGQDKNQNQNYAAQEMERLLANPQLSDVEKYELVKIKTDQLEQKAHLEEKMLNVMGQNTNRNVDKTIQVNDMYIESIKAKLMMLDQI
ncbi:UNKNOWN [Stylonychia lemnae]|uniref:Uncharacterized protein n=1 Tax=Stylonychia lemnae TaxID=5949 RepID=A0A078AXQ4_STYLE|nr:UNKNOWN [Stylonychia lemnae]|eukprot:CDW86846.1 UNKNOWN [Stylonychia lemnae]